MQPQIDVRVESERRMVPIIPKEVQDVLRRTTINSGVPHLRPIVWDVLHPINTKTRQLRGKIRRFIQSAFPFADGHQTRRFGLCTRCGRCCKIVYRCPFLVESDGQCRCGIYEHRPRQCRRFPTEARDIAELEGGCTYYFCG